jgi:hypothetical protein
MPQLDNAMAAQSLDRHLSMADHLFNSTFTSASTNAEFNLARRSSESQVPQLPKLELFGVGVEHDKNPWEQPAESRSGWESFLKFLGHGDTNGDRVRERVLKGLTPEQEKEYNHEEAAQRNWEMQATIAPGQKPPAPMHELVDHRVKATEKEISAKVKAQMSPEERHELNKELKDIDKQYDNWQKNYNPIDTLGSGPHIKIGAEVSKYFEKIAHAV